MPTKPSIIRTDAVVLRGLNYGETSRIATLFTLERGKMSVMAKGARASKSRFGSTLDPLGYVQAIIYFRPSRDLQSITEASHVNAFSVIRDSLERIKAGLGIVELTNALMEEGEPNPEAFSLLIDALTYLNESDNRAQNVLDFFRLRIASQLGYSPLFEKNAVESLEDAGGYLDLETGVIHSEMPNSDSVMKGSRSGLRAFAILARSHLSKAAQMALRPDIAQEVEQLIVAYMRYHFQDSYPDRTAGIFAQLESG